MDNIYYYRSSALSKFPNWITTKSELRSESVLKFRDLKLHEYISFCAMDIDENNLPIERQGIIKSIDNVTENIVIERVVGPPKTWYQEDFKLPEGIIESRNDELWN